MGFPYGAWGGNAHDHEKRRSVAGFRVIHVDPIGLDDRHGWLCAYDEFENRLRIGERGQQRVPDPSPVVKGHAIGVVHGSAPSSSQMIHPAYPSRTSQFVMPVKSIFPAPMMTNSGLPSQSL